MSTNIVPAALPPVVYHYTSLSAMMKILRTQTIWATDMDYLNDVSERQLLLNLVDEVFPEFAATHGLDAEPFKTYQSHNAREGPFVASFSAEPDALNQWRSYCPVANGVCIGFKTECLQKARLEWRPYAHGKKRNHWDLLPPCEFRAVSYIQPQQIGLAEKTLTEAYTAAQAMKEEEEKQFPNLDFDRSIDPLFRHMVEAEASFYKHKGFESELEYRLLLPDVYMQTHLTEFRCTRSSMVPYVSLSIPNSSSAELISVDVRRWDAVAEVVVGPTPNADLTIHAVLRFLRSIGLTSTSLTQSKIPYRDW